MNIRTLAIIAGVSLLLTAAIFLFTGRSQSGGTETPTATGSASPVALPTMDVNQPPAAGMAKISGRICQGTHESLQTGVMIVAERQPTRQRFTRYLPGPITADTHYGVEVPPGNYELYTETTTRDKVGLYSTYVACGANPALCTDHTLIQIGTTADQIVANIDICDYGWRNQTNTSPARLPTKPLLPSPTGDINNIPF